MDQTNFGSMTSMCHALNARFSMEDLHLQKPHPPWPQFLYGLMNAIVWLLYIYIYKILDQKLVQELGFWVTQTVVERWPDLHSWHVPKGWLLSVCLTFLAAHPQRQPGALGSLVADMEGAERADTSSCSKAKKRCC